MGRPSSRRSSGRSTSEREEGECARARLLRTKSVRVCPSYALAASDEGERERKESLKASCKERESPSPNASRNILTRPLSLPRPSNHLTTAAPPSQFFPHCDIHYPSAVPYPAAAAASRRHGDVGGGSRSPRTTPQPGLRSRLDLQSERFPYSRKVPEREPISLFEYWGKKRRSAQCSLRKVCMQCMRASSVIFRSVRC